MTSWKIATGNRVQGKVISEGVGSSLKPCEGHLVNHVEGLTGIVCTSLVLRQRPRAWGGVG